MATASLPNAQVAKIIEQVTMGDISLEVAAQRLGWIENGEAVTCATCKRFKVESCYIPGQPPRTEQPDSIRCEEWYEKEDPRDHALPAEPKRRGSRMWK